MSDELFDKESRTARSDERALEIMKELMDKGFTSFSVSKHEVTYDSSQWDIFALRDKEGAEDGLGKTV